MTTPAVSVAAPSDGGLTEGEARRRLAAQPRPPRKQSSRSYGSIVRANVFTVFNLILAVFGVLVIAFGDARDALFVGVLVANTAIGIFQEVRAKRALDRLAALVQPTGTVVRDGARRRVPVDEIVVGDRVELQAGDQVVADGTLTEARPFVLGTVPADGVDPAAVEALLARYAASASSRNATLEAVAAAFPGRPEEPEQEVPFSSRRKWSAVRLDGDCLVLGAPELFALAGLADRTAQESSAGRRVVAFGRAEELPGEIAADAGPPPVDLLGLVVIGEKLRPEAREAYPLLPRHLTLAAAVTIGIPGFFLALAPSAGSSEISGFLRSVSRFAVPAGTAAGLGVLSSYLFALEVAGRPLVEARTVATTTLVLVGLYLASSTRPPRGGLARARTARARPWSRAGASA